MKSKRVRINYVWKLHQYYGTKITLELRQKVTLDLRQDANGNKIIRNNYVMAYVIVTSL